MPHLQIAPGIYWVGTIDWDVRNFHGHTFSTARGTTYNAYLIVDEKVALVDTVLPRFSDELLANIRAILPLERIDYVIANHVEMDHSGALPAVMQHALKAKIFGTAKCREGLQKHYYQDWNFQTVKTGDTLSLGAHTLSFIEAPMLHWPDSMFTYCPEEALLMPNDAFGQHYATSERFDDAVDQRVLMEEAQKYYANILWPFSSLVARKIDEIAKMNIPLKMIAPSHGIVWRKDPGKIVNAYLSWARSQTKDKVVVVYESMWGSTEKMSRAIAQGLMDAGVAVKLYDITAADRTEVVKEMLESKGFLFGSSTHDNDMLPNIAGFLEFVKGLAPKQRVGAAFGSYGWGGGAVKSIEEVMSKAGMGIAFPGLGIRYIPDESEIARCYAFGKDFAGRIRGQA